MRKRQSQHAAGEKWSEGTAYLVKRFMRFALDALRSASSGATSVAEALRVFLPCKGAGERVARALRAAVVRALSSSVTA